VAAHASPGLQRQLRHHSQDQTSISPSTCLEIWYDCSNFEDARLGRSKESVQGSADGSIVAETEANNVLYCSVAVPTLQRLSANNAFRHKVVNAAVHFLKQ
jgi:hypothetical protein